MKKPTRIAILILSVFSMSSTIGAQAEPLQGRVSWVNDGDTFVLSTPGTCSGGYKDNCYRGKPQYRIRLAEVDAPETAHQPEPAQPYGQQAKAALTELIGNKQVSVRVSGTDRYGRLIGYVYTDTLWVNAKMVETGNAWVYRRYSYTPELINLEEKAKESKLGLWALPESERIPPDQWRKAHARTAHD